MYPFSRRPVHAAVFIALTGQAVAESSLPPIFITAGRVAESAEISPRSVTVVEREEIDRQQPRDLSEILRQTPSIEVGRTGGPGQQTSVFTRGTESDHTLVLIDGVPINPATIGGAIFQNLMPTQIDRVEVVRGPSSTLYGAGAIGGVVQILTPRAAPGTNANARVLAGSDSTVQGAANVSHADDSFDINIGLSGVSTDGYPPRSPPFQQTDRAFRNTSFNGAVGFENDTARFELSHFESRGYNEYLGGFGPPGLLLDQDLKTSVSRASVTMSPHENWQTRLLAARVEDEIDQNQSDDTVKTVRDFVDWQNTVQVNPSNLVVAGVSIDWTDASDISGGAFDYDYSTRSVEGYLQNNIDLGDTRIQLGGRVINQSQFGSHVTWNAGISHQLAPTTRVRANLGTAFRAPSGADLFGFGGDPTLDPETSRAGEVGIDFAATANSSFSGTLFQTDIDDLIEVRDVGGFNFQATQVEEARIRGLELGYRLTVAPWSVAANYTYQDAKNRSLDQRLGRRARNIASGAIGYAQSNWWSEARIAYQDDRPDFTGSNTILAAYTTVDLSAGYRFSPSLSVTGRVQNLFDEEYELADTYSAQGRFFSAELRYDFATD